MRSLGQAFRRFKHRRRIARAREEMAARPSEQAPHGLDGELVVSLTSFPPRYPHLAETLTCLLGQSIRPDHVVLWIAHEDLGALPDNVRTIDGLTIKTCEDLLSYKKILPTLAAYPGSTIVTADDDAYYGWDWLEALVSAHRASGAKVVCHRAHMVRLAGDGQPVSYNDWDMNTEYPRQDGLIFPTGVSGVLYAPGAFHGDVANWERISRLCPKADDIWLYWMHRLTGGRAQKIGGRTRILEWELEPDSALRAYNLRGGGNDAQIRAMIDHYGWP